MLKALIQGSDFKALSQFVSSNFFSVVSVGECFKIVSKVLLESRSTSKCYEARSTVRKCLASIDIKLLEKTPQQASTLNLSSAEVVLQCYFKQISDSPVWLLDFRKERWSSDESGLTWSPSSYFHRPSELFRHAVIGLYEGFYNEKPDQFLASLKALGIAEAGDQIYSHFDLGGQGAIKFSLASLQRSFAEIFRACEKSRSKIHPEFALLGAMLISLYDVLEHVRAPIDVRRAFERSKTGH